jgi:hypothetical protein
MSTMRAPQLVSDFFEWRWAPCVGLTAGSLAFVALSLLVIPTHFRGEPRESSSLSAFASPEPQRAIFGSSLARSEPDARRSDLRAASTLSAPIARGTDRGAPPARGFSPILERPEPPPPAPTPTPAIAEPPAPAPGSVVVIQPVPGGESREVTTQ